MIVVKHPYSNYHLIHITTAQIVNPRMKAHNPTLMFQSIYKGKQLYLTFNGTSSWKIRYASARKLEVAIYALMVPILYISVENLVHNSVIVGLSVKIMYK